MANVLSQFMTDMLAKPAVMANVRNVRSAVYRSRLSVTVPASPGNGAIYPLIRLPAHARIWDSAVYNTAFGAGATAFNLGLYVAGDWTAADQAVVDFDIYAVNISMVLARDINSDPAQASLAAGSITSAQNVLGGVHGTAGVMVGVNRGRQLWEDAGLAAAPAEGLEYDLCWTGVTKAATAGTIVTVLEYSFGN